jgi:hypothetical protein
VWEYIEPILKNQGLNNPAFHKIVKTKLAQMYSYATAKVLGVALDGKINYNQININSKYDTMLFVACLNQMSVLYKILSLSNNDLKILKNSMEFGLFRDFYFGMISDLSYDIENIAKSISVLEIYEDTYKKTSTNQGFINNFSSLIKQCKYTPIKFNKRIDEIKSKIDTFNIYIIAGFKDKVKQYPEKKRDKIREEYVDLKMINYKSKATRAVWFYLLFIIIALVLYFLFNLEIISKYIPSYLKKTISAIIFLIPFVRSFIKHDSIMKKVKFLFSKKERDDVRAVFENEFNQKQSA